MLRIHQPYIKRTKYYCALAGIGVLLLGGLVALNSSEDVVYALDKTIDDIQYMQEMTNPIRQSMTPNKAYSLLDPRGDNEKDFQTYRIVKLKNVDGTYNCWMQENLRLLIPERGLKSSDTNIRADWNNQSNVKPSSTIIGSEATTSDWINDDNKAYSAFLNSNIYYNWCAATAGECSVTEYGTSKDSICPKNWQLPSGGSDSALAGQLYGLFGKDGANIGATSRENAYTRVQQSPYLYQSMGLLDGGLLEGYGTNGYYWSSTAIGSYAYDLYFGNVSSYFYPGASARRHLGLSVRCVADPTVTSSDFTYGDIEWSEDKTGDVNVSVPSVLTIDAVSGMSEEADATKVIEGTATATISSNTEYNVTLHSTQPALKDTENSSNTVEIAVVSSSNPVQPGNNSWGFWDGGCSSDAKVYTLPITTTAKEFYNSKETITNTDGDLATKHTYYVGISISPSLPSGVYATDVIITASVK